MLIGRLMFDEEELGRFRWKAAAFIRYMIRARAKVDAGFMTPAAYDLWELDDLGAEKHSIDRLLRMALNTIIEINEKYLERCGSGGMRTEEDDPLREVKELVGFFTDYQWQLPNAIRLAVANKPIDWPALALWDDLTAIRKELDKLPRLDGKDEVKPDGPDLHAKEIRWKGRSCGLGLVMLKFAAYLWDSPCVAKSELITHIWDGRDDVQLAVYQSRLNKILLELQVPWEYYTDGDYVMKRTYSQNSNK